MGGRFFLEAGKNIRDTKSVAPTKNVRIGTTDGRSKFVRAEWQNQKNSSALRAQRLQAPANAASGTTGVRFVRIQTNLMGIWDTTSSPIFGGPGESWENVKIVNGGGNNVE